MPHTLRHHCMWLVSLALFVAIDTAGAADSACGISRPKASSPSDLENSISDLSLAHWAEQPAGPVSCSYGYLAAKCGDFETANRIFDKCIAKGYAGAMIWKGLMHEDGSGAPQDLAQAAALYRRAADSGNEQYATLGKLHYASALHEGRGVPRDIAEARKWFEKAASEGSADAQEFLKTGHHTGSRNQRGEGVGHVGEVANPAQRLLRQIPKTMSEPFESLRWLPGLLAALVAIGAWRQTRSTLTPRLSTTR